MQTSTYRQARINENNRSPFYFAGQIVEVIEILSQEKAALIRTNSHSNQHKVGLDVLDL